VSNSTPWIATFICGTGTVTLQPYTADLLQMGGNQQIVLALFTVPPGGSAVAATGSTTYVQCTYYTAGGGPPDGVYPLSLTSQAIQAAIAGVIDTQSVQTLANTVAGLTAAATVTLPTGTSTLIILANTAGLAATYGLIMAQGVTTGLFYPVYPSIEQADTAYVGVTGAIDTQITITFSGEIPTTTWYIIADTFSRTSTVTEPNIVTVGGPASSPVYAALVAGQQLSGFPAALAVDSVLANGGRLVPFGPTLQATASAVGALVAAPATGAWYVFGWWVNVENTVPTQIGLQAAATVIDEVVFPAQAGGVWDSYNSPPLGPYRTTGAIATAYGAGGPFTAIATIGVRYGIGP
jgi:hypothetical protein